MKNKLEIIQVATVRSKVEDTLREAIIMGSFSPGERIVEQELCEALGVSRTSIREALRKLEAEKLLEIVPHKGAIIPFLTVDKANKIYEVRAMMEGHLARNFAEKASTQDLSDFYASIIHLKQCAASDNKLAILKAKTALYNVLIDFNDNDIIKEMLTELHSRITQFRMTSMTQLDRIKLSILELEELYKAFTEHDGDKAEKIAIMHVQNAKTAAIKILEK